MIRSAVGSGAASMCPSVVSTWAIVAANGKSTFSEKTRWSRVLSIFLVDGSFGAITRRDECNGASRRAPMTDPNSVREEDHLQVDPDRVLARGLSRRISR